MRNVFVIFYKAADQYWEWEETSISYPSEEGVMSFLGLLSNKRELQRIFKMNENGKVTECEVVFEGRLKLREIPNS